MILHSNASHEWYTPTYVLDPIRTLLRVIELDPASSHAANERVQAERFFTKEQNGLLLPWNAKTIFLNPPGPVKIPVDQPTPLFGKAPQKKKMKVDPATAKITKKFWNKLVSEWQNKRVRQAVFLCFSLEQLQTLQGIVSPLAFPFCVPRARIKFEGAGTSPTHANAIIWLPPPKLADHVLEKRLNILSVLGDVVLTTRWRSLRGDHGEGEKGDGGSFKT